jgi:peroxiredoxin
VADGVVEIRHGYILARMAALRLGDPAPAFELPGVDGAVHSLSDHEGKPVAVVFSCCHCPYVVAWEDRLNEAARDFSGRVGFVAVNSNAGYLGDSLEDMRRRSEEKGFVFPFLYDESQAVASAYGASRTPEAFVFDAGHRLVYHGAPDSDHADPEGADPYLGPALEAAATGTQPGVQETPPVGCTIKWR